jgi:hypothetical protein
LALPRICFVIEAYFSQANLESDRQIFDKFLVSLPQGRHGAAQSAGARSAHQNFPSHHGQVRAQLPTRYFLITPPSLCCALVWNHTTATAVIALLLLVTRSRALRWSGRRAVLVQSPMGAPRCAASERPTAVCANQACRQVPASVVGGGKPSLEHLSTN